MDTKNRVAAIILSSNKKAILIGHAPNKPQGPNTWDLPKGHISEGETEIQALQREVREETNINLEEADVTQLTSVPYNGGKLYYYLVWLKHEPKLEDIKCTSMFDWFGKQLPELNTFKWININDYHEYLYKSLVQVSGPVFQGLQETFNEESM